MGFMSRYSPSRREFVRLGGSAAAGGVLSTWSGMPLASSLASDGAKTYVNPVIAGDHPDAGAIRVGNDYYLVHTTDHYSPGLLIWHSRDLVHWTAAGAALNAYYGAVWAPFLCEYKGLFYIYYPCDGKIFVIHATHPLGPWSKPISLGLGGIDPTHGATPEGRRVLYLAGGEMADLADDGLSVKEPPRKVLTPWTIPDNWQVECECLEAPKLLFHNGYYYLTVAEGGTSGPATSHMVLSARSRNIDGPWDWSPHNPIIHTRSRAEKWWSQGHGRLVDDADGSWWMTFHSYQNGAQNLGRQVLLLPIVWTEDGWYKVRDGVSAAGQIYKAHLEPESLRDTAPAFAGTNLDPQWQFWKGYDLNRFHLSDGSLTLAAYGDSIQTTSPLTRAAMHPSYVVEVDVEVTQGCEAGLILFYDSNHICGLRLTSDPNANSYSKTFLLSGRRATVRIVNIDQVADFYYRIGDGTTSGKWTHVRESIDVASYQQNAIGGFLDLRPALYACGSGSATFTNWKYWPE
ncbi:Beta-xylosidase [Acidisarcina polymorpha]|uniref:Beta-xylosidase n=2 Tax=Acidisarcina polymorpha TaxID=2211140 RepID=A0A2Z5G0X2_9BACT|nr:Beta-xylosidase [Acidisarcina polymorpha]